MLDKQTTMEILAAGERRRDDRRQFLKYAGGATAAVGGLSLLAACGNDDNQAVPTPTPTPAPTPAPSPTPAQVDLDVLNFALNLEYLEATFYSFAAFGNGLSTSDTSGATASGSVVGGKKVPFTDPLVAAYAREIASDENQHVKFLRSALGSAAVSLPSLNIDGGAAGAFTAAARAAKLIGMTDTFDPYANDENFLLAAFIFEDVGVTAYKGASPLIVNKTYLEAAAGILAAEAYHAGLIRTVLYGKGLQTPSLRTSTDQISDARDSLDGASDDDQGVTGTGMMSNIVPTDANGLAYSRNTDQVLHIVYLNAAAGTASGGFFPAGVNGNIKVAAANP